MAIFQSPLVNSVAFLLTTFLIQNFNIASMFEFEVLSGTFYSLHKSLLACTRIRHVSAKLRLPGAMSRRLGSRVCQFSPPSLPLGLPLGVPGGPWGEPRPRQGLLRALAGSFFVSVGVGVSGAGSGPVLETRFSSVSRGHCAKTQAGTPPETGA